MLGLVLRSTTTTFTFGRTIRADIMPAFGDLVKAQLEQVTLYGLVYEIWIADDPFVRQIVAASETMSSEKVEDMRQRRQVPVEITALTIAFRRGERLTQGIPPHPPTALQPIHACSCVEIREVLAEFAFLRMILNCSACPTEELLVATLLRAAECQLPGQEQTYLTQGGRELVRLLHHDPMRLDAILQRLAHAVEAINER